MNKTVKKTLNIIWITLATVCAVFLLLYFILFLFGINNYGAARSVRSYVCDVPDINSGWAPQGVAYIGDDSYIQTGYDGNNNVVMYLGKGESFKRLYPVSADGNKVKGHGGGVACTGNNVYIANDNALLRLDLNELKNAAAGAKVTVKQTILVNNRAAYCFSDDSHIYVGEFYRPGNYETESSHHYTTPDGEKNKAIVSCYKLDQTGMIVADGDLPYPEYCISVTGLVQGFAVSDGVYVMSRSYGLTDSKLEYHTAPKYDGATIKVSFKYNSDAEQKSVPLYYLDESTRYLTIGLPAFSEDITVVDDRIVVTNEASANKYFIGKLFNASKVYSYPLYRETDIPD